MEIISSQKPYLSILTATYNRGEFLYRVYDSILENTKYGLLIEWLIMDDGSIDETKEIVRQFKENPYLQIRYYMQENSGKMSAINELTKKARGTFLMDLDSDDILAKDAIVSIKENCFAYDNIYAFVFLKSDFKGNILGEEFSNTSCNTTMFDITFVEKNEGEKALVFNTSIRKKFFHRIEKGEKFVTEARMYTEMDRYYSVFKHNKVIQLCEYQKNGYTNNIDKIFKQSPYGFYNYYKELLQFDFSKIDFAKRLHILKHYILFTYITSEPLEIDKVADFLNKLLLLILYIPGIVTAKKRGFEKITKEKEEPKNLYNVESLANGEEIVRLKREENKKKNRRRLIQNVLGLEEERYDLDYLESLKQEKNEEIQKEEEVKRLKRQEEMKKRVDELIQKARKKDKR